MSFFQKISAKQTTCFTRTDKWPLLVPKEPTLFNKVPRFNTTYHYNLAWYISSETQTGPPERLAWYTTLLKAGLFVSGGLEWFLASTFFSVALSLFCSVHSFERSRVKSLHSRASTHALSPARPPTCPCTLYHQSFGFTATSFGPGLR